MVQSDFLWTTLIETMLLGGLSPVDYVIIPNVKAKFAYQYYHLLKYDRHYGSKVASVVFTSLRRWL